ncbi:MAG: hypothetical protein MUF48_07860 [Pirellulaceae bacterium]|nr:hypothetical protein [Pirellulaceae bacterium]
MSRRPASLTITLVIVFLLGGSLGPRNLPPAQADHALTPHKKSHALAHLPKASVGKCPHCQGHGQLVVCTITVPTWVSETRLESKIIKKSVEREETYTAFERVPVTQKFTKECCYLDCDVKTQPVVDKQCHIVQNPVEVTRHVKVPETHLQTEMVCREVCNPDGTVTVIEEPCTREVTVMRDDVQVSTCTRPQVVFEETKRDLTYCVKVPKKYEIPCTEETVHELRPVEKKRTVVVCVPEVVKEPVTRTVCKLIPQTVVCCEKCALGHH